MSAPAKVPVVVAKRETPRVAEDGALICQVCDHWPVEEPEVGYPLKIATTVHVCGGCYDRWLLTPQGIASSQTMDAADALERDANDYLVWPWPELARITLPMAPGMRPYFFCAFSGNGKTTFSWSAVAEWARAGVAGYVLSLETMAYQWRTGLACTTIGVSPALALSGELRRREQLQGDIMAGVTRERIRAELYRQFREWSELVQVSPVEGITLAVLRAEVAKAAALGCRYILVDHIDHITPDDYKSAVAESQRVNRSLVEIAQQHDVILLCASQLNMDIVKGDRLARYSPPQPNQLMFPAVKNQVAGGIIGLYRPVDDATDPEMLLKAKRGEIEAFKALKPNTMGVVTMKAGHQEGDARDGARCELAVRHGRVESPSDDEHRAAEAGEHGIWTGGASERPTRPRLRLDDAA